MSSQFEKYQATRTTELSEEFWNKVVGDLDRRAADLEGKLANLDTSTDALVARGLAVLTEQISGAVANLQQQIDDKILLITQATDGVEATVQALRNQVETLAEAIDGAEDILNALLEGVLPAESIAVAPIVNLVAGNVQAALEEHHDTLASLALALSQHVHSIGDVDGLQAELNGKASTASVDGKAGGAITVTGDGLAVGGGDLTDNRVITVPKATAEQFRAKADDTSALTPKQIFDAAAPVTLTDAGTIVVDMSQGFNFVVTLGGNRTLGNPINVAPGTSGTIRIKKDAAGRTLAFAPNWEFPGKIGPSLTTEAGTVDALHWYAHSSTEIEAVLAKDIG